MPTERSDFMSTARKRFATAKTAWSEIREAFNHDSRAVNVVGGQWPSAIKTARDNEDRPALEFNELHTYVQQICNRARQERPQPKITPGDGGNPDTADAIEGKIRHIQYVSQADVAYDNAVEGASTGGYGHYRITVEYVNDRSFHQEPRVRRILDHNTVYFDPNCLEPDFSDANWCFVRQQMTREQFKAEFGIEPVPFDSETDPLWGDKDSVTIAEYWQVKKTKETLVELSDGRTALKDDLNPEEQDDIINERPVTERTVHCDIIDGSRVLETNNWVGCWIPIIPVLGREVIVEGKRHLISAVRFATGPQQLKNVSMSGMAEMIGDANDSPYVGLTGQFKAQAWRSGRRVRFLEYEPVNVGGQVFANPPQRNPAEPPIQGLTSFAMQMTDQIKRAVGYIDNIVSPSKSLISGVAVDRREEQQDLTNYHFEDNLVRSQWHAGRVMLDLILNLTDTPRAMQTMKPNGEIETVPVHMQMPDGTVPEVPGFEGKPHHRIDIGDYNVTISTGPGYQTKLKEELDDVGTIITAHPELAVGFLDVYFKLKGFPELEERAKLLLPPQIQQGLQAKQQGIPPQIQAAMAQKDMLIQKLQQGLEQVIMKLQTKQVEQEGRLHVERLKTAGAVLVEDMKQRHDAAKEQHSDHMEAIEKLMEMLHESELGATPGPGMGNNAVPQLASGAQGGLAA